MFKVLRDSMLGKVAGLLLLTLLLCIPLAQIQELAAGRGESQQEAAQALAASHAGPQTVIGPLLVLPYVERWTETERDAAGRVTGSVARSKEMTQLVFPRTLHTEGSLAPQERYRGIFKIPFYTLDATLSGSFEPFDTAQLPRRQAQSTITPGEPFIAFATSDLRGLAGAPALLVEGALQRFAQQVPGLSDAAWAGGGIHAPLTGAARAAWQAREPLRFSMRLALVGQGTLSLVPIADETTAHLRSPWANPSFVGRFLAVERSVTDAGFEARWRVSSLVSSAREALVEARRSGGPELQTFGVTLASPLNVYALSTRAGKYGLLFVGLVLMAVFMVELLRGLRLHPVQYGLVGLSIVLFFLLLLALSEKIEFALAYLAAAAASVALLGAYFSAVLGGWRRGAGVAGYVAVLYAALYVILASESHALLLGALLVFGMLALLMLGTRRVDWYRLGATRAPAA